MTRDWAHIVDWGTWLPSSLLLIATLFLALVAFWSYLRLDTIPSSRAFTLGFLRFLLLLSLLALLAGVWVVIDYPSAESEPIPIFLDASASLEVERPDWSGGTETEEAIRDLQMLLEGRGMSHELHTFAASVDPLPSDSVWASETRFDRLLQSIRENFSDAPAGVILSDGLVTLPTQRETLTDLPDNLPLFTYSIGGTESLQDLVLEEVFLPDPLQTGQIYRMLIKLSRSRMVPDSMTLDLQIGGDGRRTVRFVSNPDDTVQIESVPLSFDETGPVSIDIQLRSSPMEWSTVNNQWTGTRDVVERRPLVMHIATSVHPDVRWIREEIQQDPRWRLETVDLFDLPESLPESSPDIVILHGDPIDIEWPEALVETLDQSSILWFAGPNGLATPGTQRSDALAPPAWLEGPLSLPPEARSLSEIAEDGRSHPILNPMRHQIPLASTPLRIHQFEWNPEATLQTIYLEGSPRVALLHLQEIGNQRRAVVLAQDWYRYAHSPRQEETRLVSELRSSLLQWVEPESIRTETNTAIRESVEDPSTIDRVRREIHPSARDDAFMQALATGSGGDWTPVEDGNQIERWLDRLEARVKSHMRAERVIHISLTPAWFLWMLFLATSEWALRRRYRMD